MSAEILPLFIIGATLIVLGGVAVALAQRARQRCKRPQPVNPTFRYENQPPETRERMDRETVARVNALAKRYFHDAYNLAAPGAQVGAQQKQALQELQSLGLMLSTDGSAARLQRVCALVDGNFREVVKREWRRYEI